MRLRKGWFFIEIEAVVKALGGAWHANSFDDEGRSVAATWGAISDYFKSSIQVVYLKIVQKNKSPFSIK